MTVTVKLNVCRDHRHKSGHWETVGRYAGNDLDHARLACELLCQLSTTPVFMKIEEGTDTLFLVKDASGAAVWRRLQ